MSLLPPQASCTSITRDVVARIKKLGQSETGVQSKHGMREKRALSRADFDAYTNCAVGSCPARGLAAQASVSRQHEPLPRRNVEHRDLSNAVGLSPLGGIPSRLECEFVLCAVALMDAPWQQRGNCEVPLCAAGPRHNTAAIHARQAPCERSSRTDCQFINRRQWLSHPVFTGSPSLQPRCIAGHSFVFVFCQERGTDQQRGIGAPMF